MKEFEKAVMVDGVHVVSVTDHKTRFGGAARLMLDKKLFRNLQYFMEGELYISNPSATEVRRIGATVVARSCFEGKARVVSRQMSHGYLHEPVRQLKKIV